jgi:hypothetical protein
MVLQRRREEHAALVSHEIETGGSDPLLPEFWEEEVASLDAEERMLASHFNHGAQPSHTQHAAGVPTLHPFSTPLQHQPAERTAYRESPIEDEENRWAREAAEAEEAEREAEDAEIARMVEEEYAAVHSRAGGKDDETGDMGMDVDVDWEAFDAMDIE